MSPALQGNRFAVLFIPEAQELKKEAGNLGIEKL